MLESWSGVWRIPDLRKRMVFTLLVLFVYRLGSYITLPGINLEAMQGFLTGQQGSILGFVNTFTGGSLGRAALFTLGIMPYITSSIIMQLLTVVWPYLERLSKEGELGRRIITRYTRYGTVIISVIQSFGISIWLERITSNQGSLVINPGWGFRLITVISLTTGAVFVMWLGEQITERGVGNGISLLIFASIVVGLIPAIVDTVGKVIQGSLNIIGTLILGIFMLVVVAFVVYMEKSHRRIPVQYAKRVMGRRIYGGQSTYLPLRVNPGGVIPVIFASSVVMVPQTILSFFPNVDWMQTFADMLRWGQPLYYLLYVILIIFFSFFYVSIIYNPNDLSDNLRKYGGFIPGKRTGKRTAEYLDEVLTRLTFIGSLYLAVVSVLPDFLLAGVRLDALPGVGEFFAEFLPSWVLNGLGINFYFGGTSLLIVVGVVMDFLQQLESHLVMRNYEGFMKRGRIRRSGGR